MNDKCPHCGSVRSTSVFGGVSDYYDCGVYIRGNDRTLECHRMQVVAQRDKLHDLLILVLDRSTPMAYAADGYHVPKDVFDLIKKELGVE